MSKSNGGHPCILAPWKIPLAKIRKSGRLFYSMFRNTAAAPSPKTKYVVLCALSAAHLFNDTFQSLIIAVLPFLEKELALSLTQIGLIGAVFQISSSIFQPFIGWFNDKHPQPYALPLGMTSTLLGILLLAYAWSFPLVLLAVAFIGLGSAVFHPEAARLTYMASAGRLGFAQSLFQTGGNTGTSLGPLLAAILITPYGQKNIAWFAVLAFCVILGMIPLSRWYARRLKEQEFSTNTTKKTTGVSESTLPKRTIYIAFAILLLLVFSKNLYSVSLSVFLPFYLMNKYGISIQDSQLFLFAFLFASAAGTMIGGLVGDRVSRKLIIWFSILGAAPFALLLPYVDSLWGTCLLSMLIGAILASSFPAIVIFGQELLPGKVGTVGGLFFGFSFGAAAIASALLGVLGDFWGIMFVFNLCAFVPLIGLITWFLPNSTTAK
jgi:FSR family fosmidomycin resistance protein-like MFS transporter